MAFDPTAFANNQPQPEREKKPSRGAAGFNPVEFIGDLSTAAQPKPYEPTAEGLAETAAMGVGGAAATAYGFGGRALTPRMTYDALGRPILESAGRTFEQYVSEPFRAGRLVPGAIPAQVMKGAAPDIKSNLNTIIGQLPKGTDINADQFLRGLGPDDQARLLREVKEKGLETAFKTFQAPSYLDESGRAALKSVQESFPSGMTKLGRAAGLVGRTAARVAGPVGIGMTAYDLYELGKYGYDQYQRSQQPQPAAAPVAPAQTGAIDFDTDRRIRDEAARRALQGQR
jgi:hypothetical protein